MGDRLDEIDNMLAEVARLEHFPNDKYCAILQMIVEELRYLRAQNATAKQEFYRLMARYYWFGRCT